MASIDVELDTSQVLAFAGQLEAAAAEVSAGSRVAVRTTAQTIETAMRDLAPVLTGALRDSITSSVSGTDAEIGTSIRYATYVEHGTSVMAPEPFAGPAFDQHAPELETKLAVAGVAALL